MTTQIIRGINNIRDEHKGCAVTIGNFDGVHLGHKTLLSQLRKQAKQLKIKSCVIIFEPQPREFFSKETQTVPRLMRWPEKYLALANEKIDYLLIVKFDLSFSQLSANDFVQKFLVHTLAVKSVLVGDDFHFGKNRQGNFNLLKAAGEQFHFIVTDTRSVLLDGERVSSTAVRDALRSGNHSLANKYLGRRYTMTGKVVHGDKLGRQLGFPTANIFLNRAITPIQGIYVVCVHGIEDQPLPGVANVGIRPTVNGTRMLLEVYLFDFDKDIYGQRVMVEFYEKLRDEERYSDLDSLTKQIAKDVAMAKQYFNTQDGAK